MLMTAEVGLAVSLAASSSAPTVSLGGLIRSAAELQQGIWPPTAEVKSQKPLGESQVSAY